LERSAIPLSAFPGESWPLASTHGRGWPFGHDRRSREDAGTQTDDWRDFGALRCVERIDVGKFDHPELARISVANLIAELTAAMLDGANRNG